MKYAGIMTALVLLIAGCGAKEGSPQSVPQPQREKAADGQLSGEVFVVTKGRENIKLALVTVTAIPQETIEAFIAQKRKVAEEKKPELVPPIEEAQRDVARLRAAADAARREHTKAYWEWYHRLQSGSNEEQEAAWERYNKAGSVWAGLGKKRENREGELDRLQAGLWAYDSSEYYFADLPSGVASAKTNADGQFTMMLPRTGRFALAATTTRRILDADESYYWLMWVSLDGKGERKMMLANDNLTTSDSPESVLHLAR